MIKSCAVGNWKLSDEQFLTSFRLQTASDKVETLKAKNPFRDDNRIQFDEASHTYYWDGVVIPTSVTGFELDQCLVSIGAC